MPGGHVDRGVLSSNYQQPGDIYSDGKTEAAFEVLAQQNDANWDDYKALKDKLASTIAGDSGAHNVASASILGLNGLNVYAQLVDLMNRIQSIQNGVVPSGSVTNTMLSGGITEDKLAFGIATQAELDTVSVGSKVYAYRNLGGL